jgi:GWxTD domain-containing protein
MPMFPRAFAAAGLAAVLACPVAMPASAGTRDTADPPSVSPPTGTATPPAGGSPAHEDPGQTAREAREALKAGDFDAPTAAWREGPARYLLTTKEDQVFRRLGTREDRALFIRRFWESRDPDPSTPENEYRMLFNLRVANATRLFSGESTKPGWKTDRGKIFILLGPPDDLNDAALRDLDVAVITWTYRDPPAGTTASPNTRLNFVRDSSGEYRLTTGIRLFASETAMSEALAIQAMQVRRPASAGSVLDRVAAEGPGPPHASGGRARGAGARGTAGGAVPGGPGLMAPGAWGAGTPDAGLLSRAEWFRAGQGFSLVLLTLWIPKVLLPTTPEIAVAPPLEVAARLSSADGGGRTYDLAGARALQPGADDLATPDGRRPFQGGTLVRPGRYSVLYAVGRMGEPTPITLRDEIEVPAGAGDDLTVGPIRLASRLDMLPERAGADYVPPFVLGRLRFVPRLEPVVHQGEELAFYYQVTGPALDPIEGLPDMDVEYRLLRDDDRDPASSLFGHPIDLTHEQGLFQGFSLPTTGWRAGPYRLRVTIKDNLTGRTAAGDLAFRLQ